MDQAQKEHLPIWIRLQNAWRGLTYIFLEDYKTTVPIIIVGGVLAWIADPTPIELLVIVFAIGVGILFGAFNTIVEKLCDLYSTEPNPNIKIIKDMAAGACVFYALIAAILFILIAL